MIKDLISSFDIFSLLLVYSYDAGTSLEEGWHTLETLKATNNKNKVQSIGMFVRMDEDYLYLCQDVSVGHNNFGYPELKADEDRDFHTINAIPLGSIIKIHLLNIKE